MPMQLIARDDLARVREYVGVPWLDRGRTIRGADCWGLVRLVLAGRFGVEVPSYLGDYDSPKDVVRVGGVMVREAAVGWRLTYEPPPRGSLGRRPR